jgi:4-alpha-glucanotransferase
VGLRDPAIAHRDPAALARWRQQCARERRAHQFAQYLFFSQWRALRGHCHAQGVSLMGDVPIFVAHDSANSGLVDERRGPQHPP